MRLISIFFSLLSLFLGPANSDLSKTADTSISPTTTEVQKTVSYNNKSYAFTFLGPLDAKQLSLHSNLPEKQTTSQLKELHGCKYLVNGGFYGKNDQPLGLFLTEGIIRYPQLNSSLFNGFIAKPIDGIPTIANGLPDVDLSFALQSGPQLIETSVSRTLKLSADEEARRIVVGVGKNGNVYFMGIFFSNQYVLWAIIIS